MRVNLTKLLWKLVEAPLPTTMERGSIINVGDFLSLACFGSVSFSALKNSSLKTSIIRND